MEPEQLVKNAAAKLVYVPPATEVIRYNEEDIILASDLGNFGGGGTGGGDGGDGDGTGST